MIISSVDLPEPLGPYDADRLAGAYRKVHSA